MALTKIEFGSLADPEIVNNNFEYLDEKITDASSKIYINNANLESLIVSQASTFTENINSVLQKIYPIGSLYIGTTDECPVARLFGTWEKVSEGRVLQGATSSQVAGKVVEAGLPNITGITTGSNYAGSAYKGAFSYAGYEVSGEMGVGSDWAISFDASRCSAVYKNDCNTVQPPAYLVNIWRRIA